jgi:hypothetical protein
VAPAAAAQPPLCGRASKKENPVQAYCTGRSFETVIEP